MMLMPRETMLWPFDISQAASSSIHRNENAQPYDGLGCLDRNAVYYSNRSAVYASMKDYDNAVRDAESVIRMKPEWVKGWARLAVAYFGLEQYSHSVDAYKQALKIEPDDNTLVSGRNQVCLLWCLTPNMASYVQYGGDTIRVGGSQMRVSELYCCRQRRSTSRHCSWRVASVGMVAADDYSYGNKLCILK